MYTTDQGEDSFFLLERICFIKSSAPSSLVYESIITQGSRKERGTEETHTMKDQ